MLIRSSGAGCPICGANHASCGPAGTGTPVDIPTRKDRTVGEVRKYHVIHNGYRTIMRLDDRDVKAYPDAQLVNDATPEPEPEPEPEQAGEPEPATKSRTAANKARRPAGDK